MKTNKLKIVGIIPARYKSSRFPGKPLTFLLGKPMIIWVAELVEKVLGKENVFIATESEEIKKLVKSYGYNAVITSENNVTGTDRVAEVASQLEADIYVNIQGDEPTLNPMDILTIVNEKIKYPDYIINGMIRINDKEDPNSINIPKVVFNEKKELIYMSRSVVPRAKELSKNDGKVYKQVCIYAFSKEELISFKDFGRKSYVEDKEDIEILRYFELNKKVLMVELFNTSYAVDIPEDKINVENRLKEIHNL